MAKNTEQPATENQVPAVVTSGALVANTADDFSEFAGAGMEHVGATDILIPRLTILQALSPQINKKKSEYIEGSEIGHIADVGTGELFPDGIIFLPVYFRKDYLEWAPRSTGKGLIAVHSDPSILESCTRDDKGRPFTKDGNLIAETAQFFGFNLTAGCRKSFIPMAGTQLKKSRKWLTLTTSEKLRRSDGSTFTPPMFYRSYDIGTAEESNSEGEWSGWTIGRGLSLPEITPDMFGMTWQEIKAEAVRFIEQIKKGEVRADNSQDEAETSSSSEGAM